MDYFFDKRRILYDDFTGFSYINVLPIEILSWGGACICNSCFNQFLNKPLILCFVLGDTYCDKCFERIKKTWKNLSKNDIEYDLKIQNEISLSWYSHYSLVSFDVYNKLIKLKKFI